MNSPDMFIAVESVIKAFEKLGIQYCIGASVASSAYGMARSTMDVDRVADIESQHVHNLVQMLKSSCYIDGEMILEPPEDAPVSISFILKQCSKLMSSLSEILLMTENLLNGEKETRWTKIRIVSKSMSYLRKISY